MEANPYASPAMDESQRTSDSVGKVFVVLLKLVALFSWFMATVPWLFLALASAVVPNFYAELGEHFANQPVTVTIIGSSITILPTAGLGLLGLASWRRRWRLAAAGIVVCSITAIVVTIAEIFNL